MDCTADLLLVFVWDEAASGTVRSEGMEWYICPLFFSSLSQRQSCPIQKQGADRLCSSLSVLLLAGPEADLSHTKVRSISSAGLSLQRELCTGWFKSHYLFKSYDNFLNVSILSIGGIEGKERVCACILRSRLVCSRLTFISDRRGSYS